MELHPGSSLQRAKVFQVEGKVVRIMTETKFRVLRKPLFKALEIFVI